MQGTEKEYIETRQQRSKTLRKIMSLVGCVSFGGTALFGIANMFKSAFQESPQVETAAVVSVEEQLQKERGDTKVCWSGNLKMLLLWRGWLR
ncbi:MAG: hypothetical protein F6K34_18070 [Okeania sp. SIO4D6]|nr:hypothetical protein [Okeania sp. SIO4D6]